MSISTKVLEFITGYTGVHNIDETTRLDSIGVSDDLDRVEMLLEIEDRLSFDCEPAVADHWETVGDVVRDVNNIVHEVQTASFSNHDDGRIAAVQLTDTSHLEAIKSPINRIERDDVDFFIETVEAKDNDDTLNMYQRIATKSAIYPGKGTPFGLMYAALGLAEAGEVQNKVKKAFRDDGIIDFDDRRRHCDIAVDYYPLPDERRAQIIKELGGVLWYIAAVCNEIDATMSEVALQNLDELCGRGERDTLRGDGDNR